MEFNYKTKNIELEHGLELLSKVISRIDKVEKVAVDNALGFILSTDLYANHNNPPFNRSAIDGYAINSNSSSNVFKVVDELCAGDETVINVNLGECVRIMTGSEIPDNCDCCIRQEEVTLKDDIITLNSPIKKYDNYVFIGEDFKKGELLLPKGTKISYIELGILASAGYFEVEVYSKPKIALISTGDEVVMPFEKLTKSKIFNSNIYMLEGRLKELGFENIYKKHIKDCPETIYDKIKTLSFDYDIIITTGGVSVGKKDIFHDIASKDGIKQIFWRLNIQPGTPIMCNSYNNTPIISLSGNPFASLVNFELVVREALYILYGDDDLKVARVKAQLEIDFLKKSKRRRFVRAYHTNGKVFINTTQHSSGVLSSLRNCNCLIDINPNTDKLSKGDIVNVVLI